MHELIPLLVSLPAIDNPFDGVVPDFSIFGAQFTQLWQKLLAAVWGICLIAAAVFMILGFVKMSAATASQNPNDLRQARSQTIGASIALGGLAAVAVIVGGILAAFS